LQELIDEVAIGGMQFHTFETGILRALGRCAIVFDNAVDLRRHKGAMRRLPKPAAWD
jgi:hypothetical protein